MQSNYYFLRQLSKRLEAILVGMTLAECFSQEKDELVLGFCTEGKQWRKHRDFYIKTVIRPDFVALNFPEDFRRASKNSVDLLPEVKNLEVTAVRQFMNERCFSIEFEQGFSLLFKLFGNRSNLVLVQETKVISLFNSRLLSDTNLDITTLDRPIEQSKTAFEAANQDYKKLFPTFGKEITAYLAQTDKSWATVQGILTQLENPTYYLKTIDFQPRLSLIKEGGELLKTFEDPIQASNEFYYASTKINAIDKEKGQIIKLLQKKKDKITTYLTHQYRKLSEIETGASQEEIGHIIMANLHEIEPRSETVLLFDFYRDQIIKIKLKVDATPQRNAEMYYRKAKNEKIEISKIEENIAQREEELTLLTKHIAVIEATESLKEIRKYLKINELNNNEQVVDTNPLSLFKVYNFQQFTIYVGRNAKNNDLLTQKHAKKEDLWLHARDVSGSHVVIKHQAGKNFPSTVIERAAQLAAFYSKRKNDSLCPVIVTPKKFVRKTRDLLDGQVIIDKEEVIMIEPKE